MIAGGQDERPSARGIMQTDQPSTDEAGASGAPKGRRALSLVGLGLRLVVASAMIAGLCLYARQAPVAPQVAMPVTAAFVPATPAPKAPAPAAPRRSYDDMT